jgi:hypothetical protein
MRKITLVTVVIVSVMLFFGDCGSAPTIPREPEKERIRAAETSDLNSLVKTVTSQVLRTPEVRDQFIRETLRSLSPQDLKEIVATVAEELAKEPELRSLLLQMAASRGPTFSLASFKEDHGNQGSNRLPSFQARLTRGYESHTASTGSAGKENGKRFTGDPISIVTNPSNSVPELTTDQVKKLTSGEYFNWNQVGGPDLPVKVIVWAGSATKVEDALCVRLTKSAARVRFLSFIIPSVDHTEGALGLLPTWNVDQLDFVVGHEAVRKVAVKGEHNATAINLTRRTLADGSYPVRTKSVAIMTLRNEPSDEKR